LETLSFILSCGTEYDLTRRERMKNDTRRFPLRHQKQGFLVQKDLAVYLFFSELFRQNRPEGCEGRSRGN